MIFRVQIYNFLETIRLAFQKQLMGEKAIAKLEDIYIHVTSVSPVNLIKDILQNITVVHLVNV